MTDTRTLNVPLNDLEEDLSIELLAGGGSGIPAVWGNITGTITNQIDLAEKLNEKISTPDGGTVGQFLQKTENSTRWADGEKGDKGDTGNGISSIVKTGSSGLIDTYTITFTDGTSTTFNVTNGKDGSGADIDVDSALSTTSTNPVQNKVITTALDSKANTSSLASVATSGSYNDLSNKPTIPTVPTNVSAFTNDAGYITSSGAPVQSVNGQTGNVQIDSMDIETLDDVAVNVASGNPVTISNATNENAVGITATLEPIQDLHGYDHPWAGGTGKNLFNYEEVESLSNIVNNNGTFTNAATDTRTYFAFTVQQYNGSTYVKGNNLNISASGRYSFPITVDSAITKLRIKHNGASKEFRFDFPFTKEGTFCVSVEVTSADPTTIGGVTFKNVMIESGSTATAYAPYSNICPITGIENLEIANNGTTEVTVQLGQTVYGGTLNVTTGELVVDKAMVDLGTLTWLYNNTQYPDWAFFYSTIPSRKAGWNNFINSMYPLTSAIYDRTKDKVITGTPYYSGKNIVIRDTSYDDAASFKTAMSGVQLVYELATPQTIQLTPAQLNLLTGTNIISTNADDLSVRYYASGKGNVEGSLTLLFEKVEELEERPTATTYTLSMSGNVITLTPSSGTASSITLPVYSGGVTA